MNQKKVVVHETGRVNELAVENLSADPVFLQTGDIVKGGKQDRMITNDFVLGPHSGRVSLSAFCVEQGRWGQRGKEPAEAFGGATELAAVRFDPKSMWNQMGVWHKVVELQEGLASHLRRTQTETGLSPAQVPDSPTSLMLTQTSPPVEELVNRYISKLGGVAARSTGVVGYAFAVNGTVKNADLYASRELFAAMWQKLLKSSVVEAVQLGHKGGGSNRAPVDAAAVAAFLRGTTGTQETTVGVDNRTRLVKRDGPDQWWAESRDGAAWVHRSLVKK